MDLSDKYVFCKQVNITSSMLYGDATLLPQPDVVKNGLLLELYEIQRCGSLSWAVYGSWVQSLLNADSVCPKAVRQKVLRLHSRLVKLQKTPGLAGDVDELLQDPFLLQSTADSRSKPVQKKRTVYREVPIVREALTTVNKQLASELAFTQDKCLQQESELISKDTQLEAMKQKLSEFKPHNVRRRLQRKDSKIAEQKENVRKLEKEVKESYRASTKRIQSKANYYQKKCQDMQECEEEEICKHCSELEQENVQQKQQILDLKEANAQLMDELNLFQTRKITTYKDGKYTDDVRICVMELLSRNVGIKQVEPVIKAVMKLCQVKCDRLPQHTAIDDMLIESRSLCQVQLAEALADSAHNTLHSDGTSKFGHKYTGFQVSTLEGSLSLGLQVGPICRQ